MYVGRWWVVFFIWNLTVLLLDLLPNCWRSALAACFLIFTMTLLAVWHFLDWQCISDTTCVHSYTYIEVDAANVRAFQCYRVMHFSNVTCCYRVCFIEQPSAVLILRNLSKTQHQGFFEDLCSKISYLAQFNLDICVCEIVRVECFCFIRTVVVDGDGVFMSSKAIICVQVQYVSYIFFLKSRRLPCCPFSLSLFLPWRILLSFSILAYTNVIYR